MVIKILKSAEARRDRKSRLMNHDDFIVSVIQQMRRLRMRLIYYKEVRGNHSTIMKFEER